MKKTDGQIMNQAFCGDRAVVALRVFRAIKRAGYIDEEQLCKKLQMSDEEIDDMTNALRREGLIVSGDGHHQVSRAYRDGEI